MIDEGKRPSKSTNTDVAKSTEIMGVYIEIQNLNAYGALVAENAKDNLDGTSWAFCDV